MLEYMDQEQVENHDLMDENMKYNQEKDEDPIVNYIDQNQEIVLDFKKKFMVQKYEIKLNPMMNQMNQYTMMGHELYKENIILIRESK